MQGDISKRLVSRVREYLGDSVREKLKSDLPIYEKLTWYQDYLMTVKSLSRLKYTYPLIPDQSTYPIGKEIVEITSYWFNDDILCPTPRVSVTQATPGDDRREFTLTESETFRETKDFLYFHAYTRPLPEERITAQQNPVIEEIYLELLIEFTRNYFLAPNPTEMLMKQTEEIQIKLNSLQRYETMALGFLQF